FHNFVAASAIACGRWDAFLPQTEFLPRLRPRRNLQQRASIHGRNLDFRSQRRLSGGHRNRDVNVVAFAAKNRMIAGPDNDVEIAGRTASASSIAFARYADTLPIARAWLDANL